MKNFKFKNPAPCQSLGRNGIIQTTGVEILPTILESSILLSPVTSKGRPSSSCFIEIPLEDVEAFCLALLKEAGVNVAILAKQVLKDAGYVGSITSRAEIEAELRAQGYGLPDEDIDRVCEMYGASEGLDLDRLNTCIEMLNEDETIADL